MITKTMPAVAITTDTVRQSHHHWLLMNDIGLDFTHYLRSRNRHALPPHSAKLQVDSITKWLLYMIHLSLCRQRKASEAQRKQATLL